MPLKIPSRPSAAVARRLIAQGQIYAAQPWCTIYFFMFWHYYMFNMYVFDCVRKLQPHVK